MPHSSTAIDSPLPIWRRLAVGLQPWIATAGVAAAIVGTSQLGLEIPCPLLASTGWLCPFCGGTRAAHALLNGQLQAAWQFNQLIVVAAFLAVVLLAVDTVRSLRVTDGAPRPRVVTKGQGIVIAVVSVLFMVARNLF